MSKLIIAEKPSVAMDIAKEMKCFNRHDGYIEGNGYIVTWAVGHLVGLKYPEEHNPAFKKWVLEDLPLVFPINKSLKILPNTKKQFNIIKELINRADVDEIINAGDAGREGYLIQKWIYRMAGNKKPEKVLWADSMTSESIRHHMSHLKDDNDPSFKGILQEAEARAEGDNILGINYSRALTLTKGGGNNLLSYGRCQTPLLHQIIIRDEEIEKFVSVPYFNVEGHFDKGYKGILISDKKERMDFPDRKKAESIVSALCGKNGFIQSYKKEEKKKKAPALFNLSKLQQAMGSKYGYTMDKTLSIAQSLYEKHKVLSYPRTDSQFLTMDLYNEIEKHIMSCNFGPFRNYISKLDFSVIKPDKSYFNNLKVTDHYALIPTINNETEKIYNQLTEEEKNVFNAVVLSLIAIFFPEYEYYSTEIITNIENNLFLSKGTTVKKLGYKEVLSDSDDNDKNENQKLPELKNNDHVNCVKLEVLEKMTKPPARYTPNSLAALMEKYHIGTSATRADIVNKLIKRTFIKYEKGKYISTELGRNFIKTVPDKLKDVKLTADFEEKLAMIKDGKITKQEFLNSIVDELKQNILQFTNDMKLNPISVLSNSNNGIGICPCCGGTIKENSKAFGCSNYKNGCEFVIWKNFRGKTINSSIVEKLITNKKTGVMKGFTNKDGKKYEAGIMLIESGKTKNGVYPVYKMDIFFENSKPGNNLNNSSVCTTSLICPKCNKNMTNEKWNYKCACGFSISKNICKRNISESDAKDIIQNGRTKKLNGFISKKGTSFSACLVLNGDKVEFDFN